MGLENYVPVVLRMKQFREDNKNKEVLIRTEAVVNFEKEAAYFKTTISVEGKEVSTGHALAPALGEDKEFEKAETSSIGRALANLGYAAEDEEESQSSSAKKASVKKSAGAGLGLGAKKAAPKKEVAEEIEEDEEEELEEEAEEETSEEEVEEVKAAPKTKPAGAGKLSGVMAKYGLK